jgi:hypothetical protein
MDLLRERRPDYEGFQGFFANIAEIDRFLDLARKQQMTLSA